MSYEADIETISRHVEKTIGPIRTVLHENVSDDLHIDVLYVNSSLFRRYEVLVTCGMSAVPMKVPADVEEPRYAEMLVVLPKGWPISAEAFSLEQNYWPIRLIKTLARLPHQEHTWLGYGHTVANFRSGEPPVPYADGLEICAAAILPPMTVGEKAFKLDRGDSEPIFFWSVVPLHASELSFKLEHGIETLLDLFDRNDVSDRIQPDRTSVVQQ